MPEGVSYEVDLSGITPGQRQRHHTQELRRIAFYQGIDGVTAYKARYPEAKSIRVDSHPRAYAPKPSGYTAAIIALVALWFDSGAALAASNRDDVLRLNAKLGTTFDPDRFFSRALAPSLRKAITELFAQRGAHIEPAAIKSMSQVRQAVRSAKAKAAPEGRPFAGIGTRTEQTLTMGSNSYRIEQHKGRDCIRITHDGVTQRFYLGNLQVLLSGLAGVQAGASVPPPICIYTGEIVPSTETGSSGVANEVAGTSPHRDSHISESGSLSPSHGAVLDPLTLSDRLAKLRADETARETAAAERLVAARADGRDPLEIATDDT